MCTENCIIQMCKITHGTHLVLLPQWICNMGPFCHGSQNTGRLERKNRSNRLTTSTVSLLWAVRFPWVLRRRLCLRFNRFDVQLVFSCTCIDSTAGCCYCCEEETRTQWKSARRPGFAPACQHFWKTGKNNSAVPPGQLCNFGRSSGWSWASRKKEPRNTCHDKTAGNLAFPCLGIISVRRSNHCWDLLNQFVICTFPSPCVMLCRMGRRIRFPHRLRRIKLNTAFMQSPVSQEL